MVGEGGVWRGGEGGGLYHVCNARSGSTDLWRG